MSMQAYVAAPGFSLQLHRELTQWGEPEALADGLFLMAGPAQPSAWANCIWFDVERLRFGSISEAAAALRERGPWWGLHSVTAHRRTGLIAQKLLRIRDREWDFPMAWQPKSRGAFTLLSDNELLCARAISRPLPSGILPFTEHREEPPSRAYRKLFEGLLLLPEQPAPGEHCLELGAAPGAWTWTLASRCGASVTSIDKAPLDPRIAALPGVNHRIGSAFAVSPEQDPCDWLFSDVICYPERLLALLHRWRDGGGCRKGLMTIKFQGQDDVAVLDEFASLSGVRLLHLGHNKHEISLLMHPDLADPWPRPWPFTEAASAGD